MSKLTDEKLKEYERLKEQKEKQLKRQNKYQTENYDRIAFVVKKGMKKDIQNHFQNKGFNNMSEYIVNLITNDMENNN